MDTMAVVLVDMSPVRPTYPLASRLGRHLASCPLYKFETATPHDDAG